MLSNLVRFDEIAEFLSVSFKDADCISHDLHLLYD